MACAHLLTLRKEGSSIKNWRSKSKSKVLFCKSQRLISTNKVQLQK
jgi:hypothetical protein